MIRRLFYSLVVGGAFGALVGSAAAGFLAWWLVFAAATVKARRRPAS